MRYAGLHLVKRCLDLALVEQDVCHNPQALRGCHAVIELLRGGLGLGNVGVGKAKIPACKVVHLDAQLRPEQGFFVVEAMAQRQSAHVTLTD